MAVNALVRLIRESDTDGFRWYHLPGAPQSEWMISITEVLSIIVDKGLQSYFIRTSAEKQEKTKESVTQIGHDIHDLIEADALGQNPAAKPEQQAPWDQWVKLKQEHKIAGEAIEFGVFSQKQGFAGTVDLLGSCNGKRTLFDIKTGSYNWRAGVQLGAYRMCLSEMEGAEELGLGCIWVHRDGRPSKLFIYEHIDWLNKTFLAALQCWKACYFSKLQKLNWKWLLV